MQLLEVSGAVLGFKRLFTTRHDNIMKIR